MAALLVVYDHLVGMWLQWRKVEFAPASFMQRWVFEPLHVMQHGGALGVALFFLLSGFVISLAAQHETRWVFVRRRFLRIYPPLWASILFILLLFAVLRTGLALADHGLLSHIFVPIGLQTAPDIWHVLGSLSLLNYLLGWPPINGVAWTLIIEMLFYLWVALCLPLWQRWPRLALGLSCLALAILQRNAHAGAHVFLLSVNGVYAGYLLLGATWYFWWSGRIGRFFFGVISLVLWGLFLHGVGAIVAQPPFTLSDYAISYAFAWLLFAWVLSLHQRWKPARPWLWLGQISYSLYLYHGAVGLVFLDLLQPTLGFPSALLAALTLAFLLSYTAWRWIELPSQQLGHRLRPSD